DGKAVRRESEGRFLWDATAKDENALLNTAKVYDDPLLEEYLAGIVDRLTPEQVRAAGGPGCKCGVLRDPTLIAFALPNGHIYVHTGLLSRLDNQSQLAMIAGRARTHVSHRHAPPTQRETPTKH